MLIKNSLFFSLSICLSLVLFIFISVNNVFASPAITSFLLNGSSQNITFNPNNGENVSVEAKANMPVKFTRLYICSLTQICNGTSGNYTRYFTQSDISDTIIKSWNGKKSGDTEMVSAGEYRIMLSMTEGSNAPVTEFGQYSIFVDFSSASSTKIEQNTDIISNEKTNKSQSQITTDTTLVSAHSNPEELSDLQENPIFETSAGRERMALVGSPIEFNAEYIISQKDQCNPNFKWSFGDGFDSIGKNIAHTYKYPGEYQIVLNGTCGDRSSISRTTVKVISPNISISNLSSGDTEIINNGITEINIGNWKIKNGQKIFVFPQDTIISANNKIVLSKEDLNQSSLVERISLDNPSGGEVTYTNVKNGEQQISTSSSQEEVNHNVTLVDNSGISVDEAEKLIKEYKEKLVANEQRINKTEKVTEADITKVVDKDLPVNKGIVQLTSVIDTEAINASSTGGFWSKLVDIPVRGVKSFARIFYDF